jgi:hypothetical protein
MWAKPPPKLLARNFPLGERVSGIDGKASTRRQTLDAIEGIGDVMARAIKSFFDDEHTRRAIRSLMAPHTSDRCCCSCEHRLRQSLDKTVVFTGDTEKMRPQRSPKHAPNRSRQSGRVGLEENRSCRGRPGGGLEAQERAGIRREDNFRRRMASVKSARDKNDTNFCYCAKRVGSNLSR